MMRVVKVPAGATWPPNCGVFNQEVHAHQWLAKNPRITKPLRGYGGGGRLDFTAWTVADVPPEENPHPEWGEYGP